MCPWVGSHALSFGRQFWGLPGRCWGKPYFKDLSAKEASVQEAGPVVLEYLQRLSLWAQNPTAALAFDGERMDLVPSGPFLSHVLQRLRVILERMSKRWVH